MRTVGLIGGMSWESTLVYYQAINRMVRERLGGQHSAELVMWSFDFAPIVGMQSEGRWDEATTLLADAARRLERAGAEAILICANTMHRMADEVQAAVSVPLIHVADVTARAVQKAGVRKPLLLATRYTMEQAFYRDRLAAAGVQAIIPGEAGRTALHRIIFEELIQGLFSEASKAEMIGIIASAQAEQDADGVILGCTEFGLLLKPKDIALPMFDTALIHAEAAVDFALGD